MRSLIEYWRTSFDWRAQEAKLNAFPQFKVPLANIDVHYLNVPGNGPDPKPLLLMHGWPGSVFEFLDMIPRLTDPARFGGEPEDAFTVMRPRCPATACRSDPAGALSFRGIADCFAELMTGSRLSTLRRAGRRLGCLHLLAPRIRSPDKLIGIHLNMLSYQPLPVDAERDPTPRSNATSRTQALVQGGDGLPVDPGHAAADACLCAHRLAGGAGGVDRREVPRLVRPRRRRRNGVHEGPAAGQHLASTGSPAPSARRSGRTMPACTGHGRSRWRDGRRADRLRRVPARDPASAALAGRTDLHRHPSLDRDAKGGHFAAMEQPAALAQDVADFFRPLRGTF